MRNFLCAPTVMALGCLCGNVALASSATFAISPNPAATGQAITVTAKIDPGVTASNSKLTLWLYNASNNAYVGQTSLSGLSYKANQTTTTTVALSSKLAAGGYYFNPTVYNSGGAKLWGITRAATFTVGSAGSGSAKSCTFNGKTIAGGSSVTAYLASSVPSGQTCKSQARTCSNGTLSGTYAYASCSVQVASGGGHSIKWNPGHYMGSGAILKTSGSFIEQPAGTWNQFLSEVKQLNNQDNVVGYAAFVYWSVLEPSQDKYDFSQVSALLTYLKTQLNKPKHLVLVVLPGKFASTDARGAIPNYIANSPMYGPSPVSGSYGWWGGKGNGGNSAAALHRPLVMERWIKLHQKLGAAFNGDPNFEAIMFQEDAWIAGAALANGVPDWNGATNLANWEDLIEATTRAFPNTNVIVQNTWLDNPKRAQQLERFMFEHRVAPSTMDTFGQTWVDQHGGTLNNDGLKEYIGRDISASSPALGRDMRSQIHSMVYIEGPNLGVYTSGSGYTPADICVALNKSYTSSHAFWANLGNNTPRASANWSSVLATINKCPLVNTGYPLIYP